jgi:Spy/CpxP family protein refolding chaperone
VVIFGAGVITGGLLVNHSDHTWFHHAAKSSAARVAATNSVASREGKLSSPLPAPLRRDFLNRLDHELKLTAAQRAHIEKIISDGQECTRSIWQEVEPEMHKTLMETKGKICSELTPEQQARFDKVWKQHPRRGVARDNSTNAPASPLKH